jgi:CheY-like chemotaxis protein
MTLSGLSVLVVDDEEDARDLLRIGLKSCEVTVHDAASVRQALSKIERERVGSPSSPADVVAMSSKLRHAAHGKGPLAMCGRYKVNTPRDDRPHNGSAVVIDHTHGGTTTHGGAASSTSGYKCWGPLTRVGRAPALRLGSFFAASREARRAGGQR